MERQRVPVEEIARAVSGAVASVLSKINSPSVEEAADSADDFEDQPKPPFLKRRKIGGKGK